MQAANYSWGSVKQLTSSSELEVMLITLKPGAKVTFNNVDSVWQVVDGEVELTKLTSFSGNVLQQVALKPSSALFPVTFLSSMRLRNLSEQPSRLIVGQILSEAAPRALVPLTLQA